MGGEEGQEMAALLWPIRPAEAEAEVGTGDPSVQLIAEVLEFFRMLVWGDVRSYAYA